jgi:tetrahydromethanopterin S-methyltransferase subunit G
MADELFELMTKMYGDFSGKFDKLENRLETIENRLETIEKRQLKTDIVLDHDIRNNILAIQESTQVTYRRLESLEKKVDKLSGQVEQQEFEIKVIKGGKEST